MSRIVSGKLRLDVETCDLASVLEANVGKKSEVPDRPWQPSMSFKSTNLTCS